eukprot:CAMPEP_0206480700 /NCGR_PEP_ID=MMETSP0324_2-20121206/37581_1 /ASSEMBLY_ACC=CAM_ASM_000836 /TAXON_ID=2866 /ORGANISM="Crypthecodinium cohnii, Strain Seligo" /LENGTH=186 /DNA_ID=CAMNT_0053957799 /DNA_START=110 /DNA_END=670 /DNA_ORIENTATION=+
MGGIVGSLRMIHYMDNNEGSATVAHQVLGRLLFRAVFLLILYSVLFFINLTNPVLEEAAQKEPFGWSGYLILNSLLIGALFLDCLTGLALKRKGTAMTAGVCLATNMMTVVLYVVRETVVILRISSEDSNAFDELGPSVVVSVILCALIVLAKGITCVLVYKIYNMIERGTLVLRPDNQLPMVAMP